MNNLTLVTLFLPEWALPWIMVLAVAAWILGARALAGIAMMVVITDVVLAPLLTPWIESLPLWAMVLMLIVFGVSILLGGLSMLFGREAIGHLTGTYLVRFFDLILIGPFRLLGWLFRVVARRR